MYSTSNLRMSKMVNRKKMDFVWNGQNLASEAMNDILSENMTMAHLANSL
jgi:hypothetical protein